MEYSKTRLKRMWRNTARGGESLKQFANRLSKEDSDASQWLTNKENDVAKLAMAKRRKEKGPINRMIAEATRMAKRKKSQGGGGNSKPAKEKK